MAAHRSRPATDQDAPPPGGGGLRFKPTAPCIPVERQMWPIFVSSLFMAGSQYIVGLAMHPYAPLHCISWLLTMMASGGLIGALRGVEDDKVERIRMDVLHAFVILIYLAYFTSTCILFSILCALWVWLLFCAVFMALVTWIIGPMYW